jgi:hypothetical protein
VLDVLTDDMPILCPIMVELGVAVDAPSEVAVGASYGCERVCRAACPFRPCLWRHSLRGVRLMCEALR